jgi:hypothetical protein
MDKAFTDFQTNNPSMDVAGARSDWNKAWRSYELSNAVRASAEGTLKQPLVNPSKLATRLQKMSYPDGAQPAKLGQLGGENAANDFVDKIEQRRAAIADFDPTVTPATPEISATGQHRLAEMLKQNTGTGMAGKGQLRTLVGVDPSPNYIKTFADFDKLSGDELAPAFKGTDAAAARSFLQGKALKQLLIRLGTGIGIEEAARWSGVSPAILHMLLGH